MISRKTSESVALGSAAQLVAQATAATVVDGSQYLQAVSVVSAAALATLSAQMLVQINAGDKPNTPNPYKDGMTAIQDNMSATAATFETIGTSAAAVLKAFKTL